MGSTPFTAFAVAVLAAVSFLTLPAPAAPPIPGAIRVIAHSSDNTMGNAGMMASVEQPWLSDHEVLHFRHGSLYRYDTAAKTDTALPQLTRQVKSSHCCLYFLDASPDGHQVK